MLGSDLNGHEMVRNSRTAVELRIKKARVEISNPLQILNRRDWIRTSDLYVPNFMKNFTKNVILA